MADSTQDFDPLIRQVLQGRGSSFSIPALPAGVPILLSSVAMAAALHPVAKDIVTLVHVTANSASQNWQSALQWAQDQRLPLVLACSDASGSFTFRKDMQARKELFNWSSVRTVCSNLTLPVLSVDGEDAVAVYRVMQECALRARTGGGPAVIWAMLPSKKDIEQGRKPADLPLRRLERYLKTRHIEI